jgi:hypothetical protein
VEIRANSWRRFSAHRRQELAERAQAQELLLVDGPEDGRVAPSAEDVVVWRAEAEQALAAADAQLRQALELLALGYTQPEVCQLLGGGLTPRALEGKIYRFRGRLLRAKGGQT